MRIATWNVERLKHKKEIDRISIYTNYKFVCEHTTFDRNKALCVELETDQGDLIVYGTIIGIYGNRHPDFRRDLLMQVEDWKHLSANGTNICVCGDFNCSFGDNYYYTQFARETITSVFSESHIELLTKDRSQCIDHIAVSKRFVAGLEVRLWEWNLDKCLSDHKGIVVEIKS